MPRPTKWRRVAAVPPVVYFKPAGVRLRDLSEISLSVEEVEAIRLKDVEGLEQEECARMMSVSRPTFHRVLTSARRRVADALTSGKALRIEGGNFAMASQTFRCAPHGHEWQLPFEAVVRGQPLACPRCSSPTVLPISPFGPGAGRRGPERGERHGGRWRGGGR
jgi:predicted DNA-binding protein (UPF0251 family)